VESGRKITPEKLEERNRLRKLRDEMLKTQEMMKGALTRVEKHVAELNVLLATE
jgi:hypothetical protein